METQICKYCPEKGPQPINQFGTYKPKGRSKYTLRLKCKTCRKAEEAKRYRENPETKARMQIRARNYNLKKEYGLTFEEVQILQSNQNNQCKICKKEMQKPNVDHCHKTGKIRGLLCWNCNIGLGYFKDNIENLQNAITYLGE